MTRLCDIKRRENSINRYEENPSYCKECGQKIEINFEKGITPFSASKRSFCSRSCSAKWNNEKIPKRVKDKTKTICPCCNGEKSYCAAICLKCKKRKNLEVAWGNRLGDYILNSASRAKYNSVRRWANVYMHEYDDREKKCEICGYDKVVQVAHKKPIWKFSEDDLMREVNAKDNLMWMCPNHHVEFDKGIVMLLSSNG